MEGAELRFVGSACAAAARSSPGPTARMVCEAGDRTDGRRTITRTRNENDRGRKSGPRNTRNTRKNRKGRDGETERGREFFNHERHETHEKRRAGTGAVARGACKACAGFSRSGRGAIHRNRGDPGCDGTGAKESPAAGPGAVWKRCVLTDSLDGRRYPSVKGGER